MKLKNILILILCIVLWSADSNGGNVTIRCTPNLPAETVRARETEQNNHRIICLRTH